MATDKLIPIIVAAALFFGQSAQAAQISPATAIQSCTDAVRMTVDPQFLAYFGRDQKMLWWPYYRYPEMRLIHLFK